MITGGNVTLYVGDMERAVRFYVEKLAFKVTSRQGNEWAEVDAGNGLILGLHPASPNTPTPGISGSMQVGLHVNIPIGDAIAVLENRGITFAGGVIGSKGVSLAFFADPDGNPLYLFERLAPAA